MTTSIININRKCCQLPATHSVPEVPKSPVRKQTDRQTYNHPHRPFTSSLITTPIQMLRLNILYYALKFRCLLPQLEGRLADRRRTSQCFCSVLKYILVMRAKTQSISMITGYTRGTLFVCQIVCNTWTEKFQTVGTSFSNFIIIC